MNFYIRNFPEDLNHFLKAVALEKKKTKERVVVEILKSWMEIKKRKNEEASR